MYCLDVIAIVASIPRLEHCYQGSMTAEVSAEINTCYDRKLHKITVILEIICTSFLYGVWRRAVEHIKS